MATKNARSDHSHPQGRLLDQRRSWLNLLKVLIEKRDWGAKVAGPAGLRAHTATNTRGINPHLVALRQHDAVHEHRKLSLVRVGVIHELREEQMGRDGDTTASNSSGAHAAGQANVRLGIAGEWTADVGQEPVSEPGALLAFKDLVHGRVRTPRVVG